MPYDGFKRSGTRKDGIKYAPKHFNRQKLVGFHFVINEWTKPNRTVALGFVAENAN